MTEREMLELAFTEGFSAAEVIDPTQIVFDPSFRPYCEENLCGQYGVNYACPPDCGTVEQMKQKLLAHRRALVLQTVWEISDLSDAPAIKRAKAGHNAAELRLIAQLREAGHDGLMVGASGCALCSPCARREGKPCRFPSLQYSCMSAYCIFVRKLSDLCGMEYNQPDGLLAFFGMYAFD